MRTGKINQSSSGLLNAGTWQLVEEKLLTEAATSVTFSGLNGDVDQEYRLVAMFIGAQTGNFLLRPNNVSTADNYGYQILYGSSSSSSAARGTIDGFLIGGPNGSNDLCLSETLIYAKSGYVRTIINKNTNKISTTTVTDVRTSGQSWNNTADNITSLVVSGAANSLGVGTHLFLFKRNLLGTVATSGIKTGILNVQGEVNCGIMQKIYQTTLTEAVTSVTISNLDGDTDTIYELRIRTVSGATNGTTILRINNDSTANIYGVQTLEAQNTTIYPSRTTGNVMYLDANNSATGSIAHIAMLLYAKSGYVRTSIGEYTSNIATTTVTSIGIHGQSWNNTADNITSLVILSDTANGLGIGTVIELWALRKKI